MSGHQNNNASSIGKSKATAPYNFVRYDPNMVLGFSKDPEEEGKRYSGTIHCSLKALTSLLIGAGKTGDDNLRSFFQVDGKYVIPGSSIKGMLRSLVEVLSFSHLSPINGNWLAYRRVAVKNFRNCFPPKGRLIGGWFFQKDGNSYITKVVVTDRPDKKYVKVETGDRPTPRSPSVYYFEPGGDLQNGKGENVYRVSAEQVARFKDQLTPAQEELLKNRNTDKQLTSPFPVFFIPNGKDTIKAFGLPRYFRLTYKQRPIDLAGPPPALDFASRLFGKTGSQPSEARKGRIAVLPALFDNAVESEEITAILAQPKPTYTPHYLKGAGGEKTDYNNSHARLRGRKYYWHRQFDEEAFKSSEEESTQDSSDEPCAHDQRTQNQHGQPNDNVASKFSPLREESSATFAIKVERLTVEELGALFLALDLPPGLAHRLGMGKPLGMGSVRITMEHMNIYEAKERYTTSLRLRFGAMIGDCPDTSPKVDSEFIEEAKNSFKSMIMAELQKVHPATTKKTYDELPAIKELWRMLSHANKPANSETEYLKLGEFWKYGLLPPPEVIGPHKAK